MSTWAPCPTYPIGYIYNIHGTLGSIWYIRPCTAGVYTNSFPRASHSGINLYILPLRAGVYTIYSLLFRVYVYIYTRSGGFLLYIHAGIQPATRGKSYIPAVYILPPTRYFGTLTSTFAQKHYLPSFVEYILAFNVWYINVIRLKRNFRF